MNRIDWSLCLVADLEFIGSRDIIEILKEAVLGGTTVVQLRSKTAPDRSFYSAAVTASRVLRELKVPLIINDRLDIALSCEADGIHLGQKDLPLAAVRGLAAKKIIGISVNTCREAETAQKEGADYIGAGPAFITTSKRTDNAPLGPDGISAIREKTMLPIVVIGGISVANAGSLISAGADGIAVISAVLKSGNIRSACRALRKAVDIARNRCTQ